MEVSNTSINQYPLNLYAFRYLEFIKKILKEGKYLPMVCNSRKCRSKIDKNCMTAKKNITKT
jgi:hypothetical protein